MKNIIVFVLVTTMGFFAQNVQAQKVKLEAFEKKIEALKTQKIEAVALEKEELKKEVKAIMDRLGKGEITEAEADQLKKEAAEKRALNIENRIAVLDNQIALFERNGTDTIYENELFKVSVNKTKKSTSTLDLNNRTHADFVLAIGFNNALSDGRSLEDSPYRIGGSRFAELGFAATTRVFDNSGWLRVKYGFSFQFNGLKLEDDQVYVREDGMTVLQDFGRNLEKSKLRLDNLVVPVHFEFGPSKRIEKGERVNFSTYKKLKIGVGGYAGLNIGALQKLKFNNDNGDGVKEKRRGGLEVNSFVYGLSGYVGFSGIGLYAKYDLNPIFKDNPIEERNISLGLRFDLD